MSCLEQVVAPYIDPVPCHDQRWGVHAIAGLERVAEHAHALAVGDDRNDDQVVVCGAAESLEHLQVVQGDPTRPAFRGEYRSKRVHMHHRTGAGDRGDPRVQARLGRRRPLLNADGRAVPVDLHHVIRAEFALVQPARGDGQPERIALQYH